MKRKSGAILGILFVAMLVFPTLPILMTNAQEPIATIAAPTIIDKTLIPSEEGTLLEIEITVANVEKLWGFQFFLTYDTTVLAALDWQPLSIFTIRAPSEINDVEGYASLAANSFLGDPNGITTVEPVSIARIWFLVESRGVSMLDLDDDRTKMGDVNGISIGVEYGNLAVVDGLFDNMGVPVASFSYSPEELFAGETVTFDATESHDINPDGTIVNYEWDFGDDETGTGAIATHVYLEEGTYTVNLTVTDDDDLTNSATAQITVFPTIGIDVEIAPKYWNGETPEWKSFTVINNGLDPIVEVIIVYPTGYRPDQYAKPEGWTATPEIVLRQVTFKSTDYATVNIPRGESRRFDVHFIEVPNAEGTYTFAISGTDTEMRAVTLYEDQIIDKTDPVVNITYPRDGAVIMGRVWINATASDPVSGGVSSGVDYVKLYINDTEYDMIHDAVRNVWYWFTNALPEENEWYVAFARAVDRAGNEAVSSEVKFYWYVTTSIFIDPTEGPVGTVVSVEGFGFTANSWANITFYDGIDHGVLARVSTDKYGFFDTSFEVPETPRGVYTVNATDDEGLIDTATFEVLPWITISPKSGYVGTEVTVTLTGFMNDTKIEVYYMGVATDETYDGFWWQYPTVSERIFWDGTWWWTVETIGETIVIKTAESNEKGSVAPFTFEVPENWGGYHPVWAEEVEGEEPVESYNGELFHVDPYIEIVPSTGVSGQYVTLYGKGLSPWEHWLKWNPKTEEMYEYVRSSPSFGEGEGTSGIVLDFGPSKKHIDEPHFILNNKAELSWFEGLSTPIGLNANGTMIYYDNRYGKLNQYGSPFLQVPYLQPGEYNVKVYQYSDNEYNRYYDGEEWTTLYEIDHDYSDTESASTTFTIEQLKVEADLATVIEKIDGLYIVINDLEVKLDTINPVIVDIKEDTAVIMSDIGTIQIKLDDIDAKLETIEGNIATVDTKIGKINTEADKINATVTDIKGKVVTIQSSVGSIQEDITKINGKIVAVQGDVATVKTDIGTVKTSLTDINTTIEVTNDNVATIQTDIGTIKGRLTTVEGDVATIETDIGTIKTSADRIESIKSDTSLQPVTIGLSLIAAIGAIAAAVMVLRKVYVK